MSESKLVMPEKGAAQGRRRAALSLAAWALIGWVGLAFLLVGGVDFALTWFPTDFGNPEWEFGTVTASFNGLPILVLGLGLLLASSIQTDRSWLSWVAVVGSGAFLLWLLLGVVLWAQVVPVALNSTPAEVMVGLNKAVVKTATQSVVYPLVLALLAWRGLEAARGTIGSGREK